MLIGELDVTQFYNLLQNTVGKIMLDFAEHPVIPYVGDEKQMMTVHEAALIAHLPVRTISNLARIGEIPHVTQEGRYYFSKDSFFCWLQRFSDSFKQNDNA